MNVSPHEMNELLAFISSHDISKISDEPNIVNCSMYELIFLYLLKKARYSLKITDNYVVVNHKILYTWKEEKKGYYNVFKHAPKSFTHSYWYKHRQKEKSALERELKGLEGIFPYNHRHSGVWDYH